MLGIKSSQVLLGKSILTGNPSEDLLKNIIPGGKLDKKRALEVYHDDYVARLSSVMADNFEGTHAFLGEELFFALCLEYLDHYPSTSPDLGEYGKYLDKFMKNHDLGKEYPFLPELCRLDMEFMRLFHLPKEKKIDPDRLKAHENLSLAKFTLVKALYLQKSKYPIYKIWDLKNLSDAEREDVELDWSGAENFCLYKNMDGIKVQFLTPEQVDVLEKIKLGLNLDSALENSEIDPLRVQELFGFISTSGILIDII
ncbi:MAG: hypothetical protein DRQ88_06530 [Epsilonproteobacteria bacterium]|nr:MAG: hypothetical protein DRQ89_04760 [Campylobacterota bacterium]RLA66453.1 MAG: hypothetical protein DRQ88_06530 [Campylobacterota bacterium]